MGEALITRRGGGSMDVENIKWSKGGNPLYTATYSFWVVKTSWTRVAYLNGTGFKSAIATMSADMQGSPAGFQIAGLGEELTDVLPWGSYSNIHVAKLDKDENGVIGLYLKLTDEAPWENGHQFVASGDGIRTTHIGMIPVN